MNQDNLQGTRQNMEDLFFRKEDQKLVAQFQAMRKMKETKETLAQVSGIRNDAILQKLVELNVRPETLASLTLAPLVEIAWADGHVDAEEKQAILSAVNQSQPDMGNLDAELLERWMDERPAPQLFESWLHYMRGLCELLSREEIAAMKTEFLKHGQAIAGASGRFLRLGGGISKSEAAVLQKIETAFDAGCH